MSDGKTHRAIGTLAGGGFALAKAQQQRPEHLLLEFLAGLLAGNVGARLPDVFDPPTHPRHRSLAHGIVPVAAVGGTALLQLDGLQRQLRAEADRRALLRASAATPFERLWLAVRELLCRMGAGAAAGLLGGYGSHLALDAGTPAGLPLFA
mgnify:CR=1 FL=1|jgi:membrane-bound metal-dependent hydrolase YbcI (DUF457 family)